MRNILQDFDKAGGQWNIFHKLRGWSAIFCRPCLASPFYDGPELFAVAIVQEISPARKLFESDFSSTTRLVTVEQKTSYSSDTMRKLFIDKRGHPSIRLPGLAKNIENFSPNANARPQWQSQSCSKKKSYKMYSVTDKNKNRSKNKLLVLRPVIP